MRIMDCEIKKIRIHKKKVINIRINGFDIIISNPYTGIQRTINMFSESGKTLFATLVKHWSREEYQININSKDFYYLRCIRYM